MKFKRLIFTLFFVIILLFSNYSFAADTELTINSEVAILMDSSTGKILFEKNSKEKRYPASTTKILTAIIAIENCNLDDKVTASYDAVMAIPSGYSNAAIQVGEELTIKQLLEVFLVHSANEAGYVLAEHVGGSIESFATMMNTKAMEIGCNDTHFTNPSGIHDEDHYTTAYDLALIAKYCMQNTTFRNIVSQKSCTIPSTNKYEERTFNTTNDLLKLNNTTRKDNYYYKYAIGIKTGYTSQAKNCLVSASNKDGFELISVVLGATQTEEGLSARYIDSRNIFEYGYENYTIRKIKSKDDIVTQIDVPKATRDTKNLNLCMSSDITALVSKSENSNDILPTITINENISAPISKGAIIGTIKYTIDEVEYSADLLAANDVEKSKFGIRLFQIILLAIVLFLLYKMISSSNKTKRKSKRIKIVY